MLLALTGASADADTTDGGSQDARPVISAVQRPDPAAMPTRACSLELPLCAHAPAGVEPEAVLAALAEAERALRAHDALGAPRPLPDDERGGGPAFDVYLAPEAAPLAPRVGLDPPALAEGRDAASAFVIVAPPPRGAPGGCALASDVAYGIAHAVAARQDAGAGEGEVAMAASYLASIAAPCPAAELPAVEALQRAPERAITGGALGPRDGSLLFPRYLDEVYGAGPPGSVLLGLLSIAWQRTPPGALRYRNEPDILDALRASLGARGGSLDAALLDFAVARARPDPAWLGAAEPARVEWSIPFSTLPRRLAPGRPIEPTGATYLWLDLASAEGADEVTVVADWELPALFRWALVKIDRGGAEVGRLDLPGVYGETRAQRTVTGLAGLGGLLVVGVNAGSDDRSRPFDPEQPTAARGYTVWFAR